MKRFLIILSLLCFLGVGVFAFAATWHTANQATIGWDAVTVDEVGDPIPAGMSISYEVFHVAHNSSDYNADKISDGVTSATTHTVTLTKGHWYVGVETIMTDDLDGSVVARSSTIAWSDVPADCLNGEDFGLRYYVNPNKASGLNHVSSP